MAWCHVLKRLVTGIPYTQTVNGQKHGVFFCNEGKMCGALCRHDESSSVYHIITITMRRSVIIPSVMSIVRKLREEFANIGFELYQIIHRDTKCMTHDKISKFN